MTPAQIKFLQWLALTQPEVYNRSMQIAQGEGLAGILDLDTDAWLRDFNAGLSTGTTSTAATSGWFDKIGSIISGVGQAVVTVKAQSDLMKINLERARQGLDPITAQQAGTAVGVSVGVDPATARAAGLAALVPIGLIALGVFFMFNSGNKSRRR